MTDEDRDEARATANRGVWPPCERKHTMKIVGNTITLNGNELAVAVDAYLRANHVNVKGPRTITFMIAGKKHLACDTEIEASQIYVDPSGFVEDRSAFRE